MRVLKENRVVDAVVDYIYGLTKDDSISFEEADNFVNLLAQGEVDDADEYIVFDCANGSPLGNEDVAIKAIKSYLKESKKNFKKRIKESFDNPIDEIIMPYTNWSSTPLRSDANAMAENAKEAAEELKANGFTAEEVKAHFDEDGYYDAVNGVAEGNGTWDRAFANCILTNLKESKKNSKKRINENANLDDVYYVVLSCPIQCDEFGNPEDWGAVEFFDNECAKFEAKARELGMNEVCWDDGDAESGPIIKGAGIFYGPVEKIRDLVNEGFDIEVYENCQDEQPYELTGRIYDVNSLVYDTNGLLGDEEINTLDEDDVTLRSIPSYKSLRESELDDLVNKPFSELVEDFLNKLVADGLLEENVKEIFIADFKSSNEPEDIDIDLLYDGVGADPHDPANQEMFAEIAKMIEDAYQFKDEWAGIDASDMIDEDDPLYGYGEEDLVESKKSTKKSIKEDRSLGRTPKPYKAVERGTTVLERDGEPWTVIEKGSVSELNEKYPECQIYERPYYNAVYVGDPICQYGHEDRGKHIFVYGDYDDVYNNVLAYYDDVPTRSWSVYMKESKKAPNKKTLKEDAIAKDRVGIEIKSSKGWVWASKDGLKPGAPLEYKNEKAAKSSKEWEKFLDKYGEENLRVNKANN